MGILLQTVDKLYLIRYRNIFLIKSRKHLLDLFKQRSKKAANVSKDNSCILWYNIDSTRHQATVAVMYADVHISGRHTVR